MTSLGDLTLASPRLPSRPPLAVRSVVMAVGFHGLVLSVVLSLAVGSVDQARTRLTHRPDAEPLEVPRLVFLAKSLPDGGGGGGGGGDRQSGPIRRAESIGHDAMTVRIARPEAKPAEPLPPLHDPETAVLLPERLPLPSGLLLDARPMASGTSEHIGLPDGGVSYGSSQGPGSGGGVGSGVGTGIGPGEGPGFGPGSGGGIGGGVYRPGGSVSTPRILTQVQPQYTADALRLRIQGSVVLEAVVTKEGLASVTRVARSLDPGLDAAAIRAIREWRFAPGRLGVTAVDVEVLIEIEFRIR